MNISLISTKAVKIDLEPLINEELDIFEEDDDFDFRLDFSAHRPDNEGVKNSFAIAFKAIILCPSESVQCSVIFLAQFKTSEDFEDDYLKSKFALINAPAIGYPFLRAFIANTLVNAGYETIMLPTINFVKLYETKIEKINSEEE